MHSVGHQSDPDDGEEITSHTIPNKKLLSNWLCLSAISIKGINETICRKSVSKEWYAAL